MNETQFLINHIELFAANAHIWGFIIVFVLMAIESSLFPFPSEVIMIPAGFLAYRGELTFGHPMLDLVTVIVLGVAGSVVGAYFNYYLALLLGRPFLYKYGKYFFLKKNVLERSEEIFRKYGDITTFVCRLLPAIRQLISLPAGLSEMPLKRFTFFTALGAGIWVIILSGVGYYLGSLSHDMSYAQLVEDGKNMITQNYLWVLIGLAVIVVIYIILHKKIMSSNTQKSA